MGGLQNLTNDIKKMRGICKNAGANFYSTLLRSARYRVFHKKKIIAHKRVIIKGIENIKGGTTLAIGLGNAGFVHDYDVTYLNIRGSLYLKGNYNIGRGCRIDIAKGAEVTIGEGGYINAKNTIIINNKLVIGNNCIVSWNCQFLDDDFHELEYDGRVDKEKEIVIGNNVWIGCGVELYKGTFIPDGCVIAAGTVVRNVFTEENCLIAGNPAKIVKRNVSWR